MVCCYPGADLDLSDIDDNIEPPVKRSRNLNKKVRCDRTRHVPAATTDKSQISSPLNRNILAAQSQVELQGRASRHALGTYRLKPYGRIYDLEDLETPSSRTVKFASIQLDNADILDLQLAVLMDTGIYQSARHLSPLASRQVLPSHDHRHFHSTFNSTSPDFPDGLGTNVQPCDKFKQFIR
jgi:hypothetical protein